jgi:signal transduction histidine kinase/sugar lactone lactonase YvrE
VDSRGDIWVATNHVNDIGLVRWERATGKFHRYAGNGLPSFKQHSATAFREDAAGSLWIGFSHDGGLIRYRRGRFESFTSADGVPKGNINVLFLDHAGRLWIAASEGGLSRIDDLTVDSPRFISYTRAEGLSSNEVWCVTEDRYNRIYFGTGRALDRLDPATGQIKHFTQADGLATGIVQAAHRDRRGALWFVTNRGVSRFDPLPDREPSAPSILISGLQVAGMAQPISELGETTVGPLELRFSRNNLNIDFFALKFGVGEVLKYQYKLEGADADWSQPSEERTVNFASLAPGDYRLLVRAVSSNGLMSQTPASVSFTILRPVWQRWWFLTLAALGLGLTAFAFYRSRVERIVELERMRTRIATDLHDDIGSSLSQIAILSEVSRRRVGHEQSGVGESLAQIANTSRDLVDTMSDIVWAINPRRDRLSDLVQRMREFAGDVFTAREIEFSFRAPSDGQEIRLDADVRRQLYLIFKEAVNNAARHAQCAEAEIEFEVAQDRLLLRVRDNGRGFDPNGDASTGRNGNGLASMRQRARALGGEIEITSQPNQGTAIKLDLPLDRRWSG